MPDLPVFTVENGAGAAPPVKKAPATGWTDEQRAAIETHGGRLLVSAGAGSGKTAVLTQRVLDYVLDGGDIRRLLVVTFTRAAAAEMRSRIHSRLLAALAAAPGDRHLQRQSVLVGRARICTIDALFAELVRSNFNLLEIQPDFRMADTAETLLARRDILSAVVEEEYESSDPDFLAGVRAFSGAKDDRGYFDTLTALLDWLDSLPFPMDTLRTFCEMYAPDSNGGLYGSVWFAAAAERAVRTLKYHIRICEGVLDRLLTDPQLADRYAPLFYEELSRLNAAVQAAEGARYADFAGIVAEFSFGRLPVCKDADASIKESAAAARNELKKCLKDMRSLFSITPEMHAADLSRLYPVMRGVCRVAEKYYERAEERMREKGVLSFSDVSHLALRLLVAGVAPDSGEIRRTDLAREYGEGIDEILIDEYQDTNALQNMAFEAISRGGANLFCVGDVKQSIYKFRRAAPEIFASAIERARPVGQGFPAVVPLYRNFRSSEGVLDFVNLFFSAVMSRQAGDVDYDESHAAVAGFNYPPGDYATCVDMLVTGASFAEPDAGLEDGPDADPDDAEDDGYADDAEYPQAVRCAQRISQLINEGTLVYDKDKKVQRPIRPSDIAVIMPSVKNHGVQFVRAIEQAGLPAFAVTGGGMLEGYESLFVLALLTVIDDPFDDIALAAALRSPLFGFSAQRMCDLRETDARESLYYCLRSSAQAGCGDAVFAFDCIERYRAVAAQEPVHRLVRDVYTDFSLLSVVGGLEFAETRRAALRRIYDCAVGYERGTLRGLYGFLRYMERLRDSEKNNKSAAGSPPGGDYITVATIHSSKGLEYPVVILCGMDTKNMRTDRVQLYLHDRLGVGVCIKDYDNKLTYPTAAFEVIKAYCADEDISERLRTFYVAMTRARERLIIITALDTGKTAKKRFHQMYASAAAGRRAADPAAVLDAKRPVDWLLTALCRHTCGGALAALFEVDAPLDFPVADFPIKLNLINADALTAADAGIEEKGAAQFADMALIAPRLDYEYPYAAAVGIPAKVSVTQLKGMRTQEEGVINLAADDPLAAAPLFASPERPTGAQRGSALHKFMQFADVSGPDCEAQITDLAEAGVMTAEEAAMIDRAHLKAFWDSPLAARIRASSQVRREYRFLSTVAAGVVRPGLEGAAADERVLLQGVADLFFIEDGRIVLVDYKTDRLADSSAFVERYALQLELYAAALADVTGLEVAQRIIYSFYLDRQIDL